MLSPEDLSDAAWPDSDPVGEVLLVSDQDRHASVISSGPFAGRSLRGLMLSEREALIGEVTLDGEEQFPLVLKLVEARTNLSLQVHPDATAARKLGVQPKSECWYLLDADPGAEVFLGLGPGVDATSFASWARTGLDGLPRETHLDEALRSIDFGAAPQPPGPLCFEGSGEAGSVNQIATLRRGERFEVDILDVHDPEEMASEGRPTAILVLSGSGRLDVDGVEDEAFPLTRGGTWVLPADLPSARIVDADGELRVLRARPTIRN